MSFTLGLATSRLLSKGGIATATAEEQHDMHAHSRMFSVGELVYARNFRPGEAWLPGCIMETKGPVSFLVKLQDGRVLKRHVDHLRKRSSDQVQVEVAESSSPSAPGCFTEEDIAMQASSPENVVTPTTTRDQHSQNAPQPTEPSQGAPSPPAPSTSVTQSTTRCYPSRTRAPPDQYRC